MIAVRTLGTIYLDGQPVEPDSEYRWEKSWKEIREEQIPWYPSIAIGDTDLAYPITWFPVGNLLVPTQNLLIGVHWNDLVANDLALAKNIIIELTNILSAIGSKNLPKSVTSLFFLAKYPSSESVRLANANTAKIIIIIQLIVGPSSDEVKFIFPDIAILITPNWSNK